MGTTGLGLLASRGGARVSYGGGVRMGFVSAKAISESPSKSSSLTKVGKPYAGLGTHDF